MFEGAGHFGGCSFIATGGGFVPAPSSLSVHSAEKKNGSDGHIRIVHAERSCDGSWVAWAVRRVRPRFYSERGHTRLEAVGRLTDQIAPLLAQRVTIETLDPRGKNANQD